MPIRNGPIPKTGGFLTFLGALTSTIDELKPGMVGVFGVPFDISSPDKLGPRLGPQAYRETSTYFQSHTAPNNFLVEVNSREKIDTGLMRRSIRDLGNVPVSHVDWNVMSNTLRDFSYRIAAKGAIPLAMGGDQFITYPLVQGFRDAVLQSGGEAIGYIQFSSRLDLGNNDPLWGNTWRGATVRRLLDSHTVKPENLVWLGTNGYVPLEQWEMAKRLKATVFTTEDIRQRGIKDCVTDALNKAGNGCDKIYVGIDMDVLDGGYVSMTGTPRFDGLKNIDLFEAMGLIASSPVNAISLCGLNPTIETMSLGKTGQRCGVEMLVRFLDPKLRELHRKASIT